MSRAALLALAPLLLLALAPVACVLARSVEVEERIVRPAGGEGDRGTLAEVRDGPHGRGGREGVVDLETIRTVRIRADEAAKLDLRPGAKVEALVRRDGTGTVWPKAPEGYGPGPRRATVVASAPGPDGVEVTLDLESREAGRWPAGVPELPPGTPVVLSRERRLGLDHYAGVLGGAREWELLGKSLAVAAGSALVAFLLGFPLALLTTRTDLPGRRALGWLYAVPLVLPTYAAAIGWIRLGGATGLLTRAVRGASFTPGESPLLPVYGLPGSVLVLSLGYFPLVTLLARVSLLRTDAAGDEAGLLVARPARVLAFLSARAALPAAASGATFVFLFALSSYAAPSLLRYVVFSQDVFASFQTGEHVARAAATSVPLLLAAAGALAVLGAFERRRPAAVVGTAFRPARPLPLGSWRWPAAAASWGLLLLAVGVPFLGLAWQAGTLARFPEALADMRLEFRHSLATAAMTSAAAAAVALPVGVLLARGRWREGSALDLLLLLPFALPAAVTAAGMIQVWNRPGLDWLYGTVSFLSLALLVRSLPFAVRPVAVAARAVAPELRDAAVLAGASPLRRGLVIGAPLLLPGIGAAAVLVFVLALTDLDTALLAAPPGWETVQVRVFNAIHFGRDEIVCAACIVLALLTAAPPAAWAIAMARKPEVA
ncbi:MAG: hypothetical protein L0216_01000 [Planctomycetales bacterium]|nr:hypothetical protein [Planctomycetales bacterium]